MKRNEKEIEVKFPNGDIFVVDLWDVAVNRAKYYSTADEYGEFEEGSMEWDAEIDLVMNDDWIGLDWLQNNMDWVDIFPLGYFKEAEIYNYNEEFLNSKISIKEVV